MLLPVSTELNGNGIERIFKAATPAPDRSCAVIARQAGDSGADVLSALVRGNLKGRYARRQAEELWTKAGALQQAKKYEEALALYRKGLELSPDTTVSDHVARLEAFMPGAKARAEAIWKQAGQLQNGKKYGEALKKYREGLDIYHNKVVEDHVRKLEAFIARQKK